ncbi:MAG TPA: hypothetical protein ACFCUY_17810 [Xenococcaceae cyanobacterium]
MTRAAKIGLSLTSIVFFCGGITAQATQAATIFSGAGSQAATAFTQMQQAIGGADNTLAIGPQADGFRTVNWDGVLLDGTDFNGNTEVIVPDKVVGIPEERFLSRGALYDEVYFVSGDGFTSVNSEVEDQFFPFSPENIFAHIGEGENENEIRQSFTLAGTEVDAATRGFGAIFLDVELPNTSSIEFFSGSNSLGKYFVEPASSGEPSFLGVLFDSPVVTEVELILGNGAIFDLSSNNSVIPGVADAPEAGVDLVATDDFLYAEPEELVQGVNEPHSGIILFLLLFAISQNQKIIRYSRQKLKLSDVSYFPRH